MTTLRNALIALTLSTASLGGLALNSSQGNTPPQTNVAASAPTFDPPVVTLPESPPGDEATTTTTAAPVVRRTDAPVATTSTTLIKTVPPVPVVYSTPALATMHSAAGESDGERMSSCWRYKETQTLCACGPGWTDPAGVVIAKPGERLPITFDRTDTARKGYLAIDDRYDSDFSAERPFDAAAPSLTAPMRPGTYWIHVTTWWPEGDVSQALKLQVKGTHAATDHGSILGAIEGDPEKSSITLTTPTGRVVEGALDHSGRFRFDDLPAGTYTLDADVTNHPSHNCGPEGSTPSMASSAWFDSWTIELRAGEVRRADVSGPAQ